MAPFTDALANILSHVPYYIGVLFSFAAGFAFLIFLRGFLSGFPHMLTIKVHEEHMEHYRTRAVWGVVLLVDIFLLWMVVRVIESIFGYGQVDCHYTFVLTLLWIFWRLLAWWLLS